MHAGNERAHSHEHGHLHSHDAPDRYERATSPMHEEDGVGDEDTHRAQVTATFDRYLQHAMSANRKRRADFYALSDAHQALLPDYAELLTEVDNCLLTNHSLIKAMIEQNVFPPSPEASLSAPSPTDAEHEGKAERDSAYSPILHALDETFRDFGREARSNIRVLVPGAGLARLAWEIVCLDLLAPVTLPDVLPSDTKGSLGDFSFAAGDWLEIYSKDQDGSWDCIVTCFFIDTARNIVEYLELIHRLLRPGGTWINCGPSLWHFENTEGAHSIELMMEDIKALAKRIGFVFQKYFSSSARELSPINVNARRLDEFSEAVLEEQLRQPRPTSSRRSYNTQEQSSDGILVLEEADSSVEVIQVVKPKLTDATNAPRPASAGSGWFTKPNWVKEKDQKAAEAERGAKRPSRGRPKGLAKAERDQRMRDAYEQDYDWRTCAQKRPRLVYTADEQIVNREVSNLLENTPAPNGSNDLRVLGFDLEWDPSRRRGIENSTALLQLCNLDTILLVHLSKMKKFPESVKRLMEDPTAVKCGVQIGGDAQKLRRDWGIRSQGLLELSTVAKTADPTRYKERNGLIALQELVGVYLQRYLQKGEVRTSLWSRHLSEEQKRYAADDVYSSLQTCHVLLDKLSPEAHLATLVSDDPSAVSAWRIPGIVTVPAAEPVQTLLRPFDQAAPPTEARAAPKPRELEAYALWHTQQLSLTEAAERMRMKPISVVWNLLGLISTAEGTRLPYSGQRLVEALHQVQAMGYTRLMQEHGELVRRLQKEKI
ncbi:hypothetical protein OIV83_000976 [Microbotryomycetes sp. JL201]|nr:hypothetical protein OIV83_000976 [Microbotryomycetes sp. JL201]